MVPEILDKPQWIDSDLDWMSETLLIGLGYDVAMEGFVGAVRRVGTVDIVGVSDQLVVVAAVDVGAEVKESEASR